MPTPTKKPTIKALQADLDKAKSELDSVRAQLAERDREIEAHRQTEARHAGEIGAVQAEAERLRKVLVPLHEKTKTWGEDEWPPAHISLSRELTWGDLKNAADALKR
jgi:peptidoglycan hydrolase CwlO-like protein